MNKWLMGLTAFATLTLAAWQAQANPYALPGCRGYLDVNQDGKITQEEVKSVRENHFSLGDRNQDGFLTPDEWLAMPTMNMRPHRMNMQLARMDFDRDGRISREEFINFIPPGLAMRGLTKDQAVAVTTLGCPNRGWRHGGGYWGGRSW